MGANNNNFLRALRTPETPVALVHDAGRAGEAIERTTLARLDAARVSMRTLMVVAGESGRTAGPWLVAERGRGESPAEAAPIPNATEVPA